MAAVSKETRDNIPNIDDYTIDIDEEDEPFLQPTIQAIVTSLNEIYDEPINPFIGNVSIKRSTLFHVNMHAKYVDVKVAPTIVIQFLDKYTIDPKQVIGLMIPELKEIFKAFSPDRFSDCRSIDMSLVMEVIYPLLGRLFKYESLFTDEDLLGYDTFLVVGKDTPFHMTRNNHDHIRDGNTRTISREPRHLLYMMLHYVYTVHGVIFMHNKYLGTYVLHYIDLKDILASDAWESKPTQEEIDEKMLECEQYLIEK